LLWHKRTRRTSAAARQTVRILQWDCHNDRDRQRESPSMVGPQEMSGKTSAHVKRWHGQMRALLPKTAKK
jgi:hypothetical protein